MKKAIAIAAVAALAFGARAATVGWSIGGVTGYSGNEYLMFVIDQNNVESVNQIEGLVKEGKDLSSYTFASGQIGTTATTTVKASDSGKILGAGIWTSFFVVYNSDKTKAITLSGAAGQTKTIAANTTTVTFAAGSVADKLANSDNWVAVPEPTTVALLALGLAAVGLKRKVA